MAVTITRKSKPRRKPKPQQYPLSMTKPQLALLQESVDNYLWQLNTLSSNFKPGTPGYEDVNRRRVRIRNLSKALAKQAAGHPPEDEPTE